MQASRSVEAEIDRVARLIPQHFNSGDMAAIGPLYTEDCVFMVHGAPATTGRQAVVAAMAALKAGGVARLETWRVEVQSDGGSGAAEHGGYRMFDGAGAESDRGKYVVLWRKDAAGWKLHWDMFNSDLPQAQG